MISLVTKNYCPNVNGQSPDQNYTENSIVAREVAR